MLTDLAYPGWEVTVNGAPAEPVVVDGMHRGVEVAAGRHRVVWSYRPRALLAGAIISGLAVVVFAAAAVARLFRWPDATGSGSVR